MDDATRIPRIARALPGPVVCIPRGTVLYRGVGGPAWPSGPDAQPPPHFGAGGATGNRFAASGALCDLPVEHLTDDPLTAEGYAGSCRPRIDAGWVLRYVVECPFVLYDATPEAMHFETDEVFAEFGVHGLAGYVTEWRMPDRPGVAELGVIAPARYLRPDGAFPCRSGQWVHPDEENLEPMPKRPRIPEVVVEEDTGAAAWAEGPWSRPPHSPSPPPVPNTNEHPLG